MKKKKRERGKGRREKKRDKAHYVDVSVPWNLSVLGPSTMMKGNSRDRSHATWASVGQKMVYVVSLAVLFCRFHQGQSFVSRGCVSLRSRPARGATYLGNDAASHSGPLILAIVRYKNRGRRYRRRRDGIVSRTAYSRRNEQK